MRVVADRDVVLEGDVEPLQVLPHQDQVDVLVPPTRQHGSYRAEVGVKPEFFPEAHVDRAEAAADWCGQGSFEREPGAADAVDRGLGQRVALLLERGHAALLHVPGERRAEHIEDSTTTAVISGPIPSPGIRVAGKRSRPAIDVLPSRARCLRYAGRLTFRDSPLNTGNCAGHHGAHPCPATFWGRNMLLACAQATALMLMMPGLVTDASTMWADPDRADGDGTWPAPAGGTRAPPPAAGRSSLLPCSGYETDGGRPCDRHRPG